MNGSNRTHWFALDNEQALAQLKEDFWDVFLAKLRSAVESGALSEDDIENHPMTIARCVLFLAAEATLPWHKDGKAMLENLRSLV